MASCCCNPSTTQGGVSVSPPREDARHWLRLGLAALIAGQSMVFSMAINLDAPEPGAHAVLHGGLALAAVVVFLLIGLPMARSAWEQLRVRRLTVEQFFLAGILGAFAASVTSSLTGEGSVYYEVVSVLLAIYSLGKIVGERQRRKALASASALREAFETCARLGACGGEESVPVTDIRRGDRVRVHAGAGIPVDGVLVEGRALVSETPLNGEPFPVVKRPGDRVRAGGQVIDAAVVVRVEHDGRTREIDRLIDSVESSVGAVSPLQREADRIVAWFLPLVLVLAVVTAVFWNWQIGWAAGLFRGLAVLVVACPCAMGLATPIALWAAAHNLARNGLAARRGDFIERLARVDMVVFDKTGTLSEEHLHVVDWVEAPGQDRRTLEAEVAALQSHLAHPVARAFRSWTPSPDVVLEGGINTLPARGVSGRVRTASGLHEIELGNESLAEDSGREQVERWKALLNREETGGVRWIVIRRDGQTVGLALLRENLRASARRVIDDLHALGIEVGVMTGDQAEPAAALNLPGVRAGLTAVEKADGVRALQAAGRRVLFVGDGVNDAPAMACAHASVALGSGSALSRETADAQLFGHDLSHVAGAIRLSRGVVRRIRQNLVIAACYNLTGIALAMSGWLHPIAAAVLMLVSSATVSTRALLGGIQRPPTTPSPAPEGSGSPVAAPSVSVERRNRTWMGAVTVLALGIQGLALVYLGGYSGLWAVGLSAGFALAACVLWSLRRFWIAHSYRTAFLAMITIGNAGMVAGWWGDAGWGPAVRDGLCLCGCTPGHFVDTLKGGFGWMHLGMVAGALPGFWWDVSHRPKTLTWDWRWLVCLAFMWLGMQAGAWMVMGAFTGQPQAQLLATFAAMSVGMLLAMLVVCGPRLWEESRRMRP